MKKSKKCSPKSSIKKQHITRANHSSLKIRKEPTESSVDLNFFHESLFLIVSLLHGSLFFLLCEKILDLINNFSLSKASYLLFLFCVFFRIFQTHLLAAIKYTNKWVFKPLDYILVFGTSLFEYLMFSIDRIQKNQHYWYYSLLFLFCFFGVIGYALSYIRTRKSFSLQEKKKERILQCLNILCIILVGAINAIYYFVFYRKDFAIVISNASSSIVLLINILLSLSLSKDQLRFFIKM